MIGDGSCNAENNLAACGWDGGDVSPLEVLSLLVVGAAPRNAQRCVDISHHGENIRHERHL